uniref:Uncharacterized protein n=1 Tax=Kalmanozyma brasiliensis (strain GHG001) TaxID=1365824 RepID=V5ENU2_KALBG
MTDATSSNAAHFPEPNPTASLLLSHRPPAGKIALVLGTGKLAASRCFALLEAGIRPVVISVEASARTQGADFCPEIAHRLASHQVSHHSIAAHLFSTRTSVQTTFDAILDSYDGEDNLIFAVCVTDTLHSGDDEPASSAKVNADDGDDAVATEATLTSYARAEIISRLYRGYDEWSWVSSRW